MRPVLFELGPIAIHSYGVLMAAAGLAAWVVVRHELQRRVGRGAAAAPLMVAAVVGGFVGARIYYAIEHLGHDGVSSVAGAGGFTWYGGMLGGAVAVALTARHQRVPFDALVVAAALALPLAYAIGRIGCQLAGDGTYGVASGLPWAMSYPNGVEPTTARVHPAPVYETLASLLIFAALWRLRDSVGPARLFGLYLVLAGAERFLVELVRRNEDVVLGLTQPQLFAAALLAIGVALLAGARPRRTQPMAVPVGGPS